MKTTTIIIIGTMAAGVGLLLALHRLAPTQSQSNPTPTGLPVEQAAHGDLSAAASPAPPPPRNRPQAATANANLALPAAAPETKPASPAFSIALAADWVTSPHTTFQKKQEIWKYLAATDQLDPMIAELEQRAAHAPEAPEIPAALGQAYLQKCAVLKEVREQGIFGLKADQVFDSALKLDPQNWDARFWKSCAMAHWPAQMNKGQEVMENFSQLIEQQETMPVQPHFAESYLWLGQVYEQNGQVEQARQIWQRGARWFPDHYALRQKLLAQSAISAR